MTYRLMGYRVEPREQNASAASEQQQTTTPPDVVVYETEDLAEAKKILSAGGFAGADEVWHVVNEVKFDPETTDAATAAAPISKTDI